MQLRNYQQQAVSSLWDAIRNHEDNPCIVLPTGAGKTPVMADISKDAALKWGGKVIILAHVKELLQQTAKTIRGYDSKLYHKTGVYSAGLKSRQTDTPIVVAGIQSAYKRACEFGKRNLIIIDECHLIPPDGEGMYRTFIDDMKVINPDVRVIGLTATPYRLKSGLICGPDNILNFVCHETGVRELIVQGYLSKLIVKSGRKDLDTSKLHMLGGEFKNDEVNLLVNEASVVNMACEEILGRTEERTSVLIFCAGVKHAEHVADKLLDAQVITGETPATLREELIRDFKQRKIKYLLNVNVLTTGFDAPNVDCVAMLRPTASAGLYYQMCGRGFRICEGKEDCLVLDFAGNVMRHGPVDMLNPEDKKSGKGGGVAPTKKCPSCGSLVAAGYQRCPDCQELFPEPEGDKHNGRASTHDVISDGKNHDDVWHDVLEVNYHVHRKRDWEPGDHRTMRVEYKISFYEWIKEWVCVEHDGFAKGKALTWWQQHCKEPMLTDAIAAVELARKGGLAKPTRLQVRYTKGEPFPEFIARDIETMPDQVLLGTEEVVEYDKDKAAALLKKLGFLSATDIFFHGLANDNSDARRVMKAMGDDGLGVVEGTTIKRVA